MLKPKPPAPEWCRYLYQATYVDSEWVVVLESESEAKRALLVMSMRAGGVALHASPLPDHPHHWYVGEVS